MKLRELLQLSACAAQPLRRPAVSLTFPDLATAGARPRCLDICIQTLERYFLGYASDDLRALCATEKIFCYSTSLRPLRQISELFVHSPNEFLNHLLRLAPLRGERSGSWSTALLIRQAFEKLQPSFLAQTLRLLADEKLILVHISIGTLSWSKASTHDGCKV